MKKLFILGLLLASLSSLKAQVSINTQIGASSEKAPTAGLNLQAKVKGVLLAVGFDDHISKDIHKGNLVWLRAGGSFNLSGLNCLEVSAGAGQYNKSSDVKSLNEGVGVFAVYFVHQMASRPEAGIVAGITTTNKYAFGSVGLRFTFGRGERRGCPSTWVR